MFNLKNLIVKAKKVENKDAMEAIVAACLLIAASDGEIEKEELAKMEKPIGANDNLSHFKGEIGKTIQQFTDKLEADFNYGKSQMLKQIADIANNDDNVEDVIWSALAIAKADGEIDDKEMESLEAILKVCGRNLKEFGILPYCQ